MLLSHQVGKKREDFSLRVWYNAIVEKRGRLLEGGIVSFVLCVHLIRQKSQIFDTFSSRRRLGKIERVIIWKKI